MIDVILHGLRDAFLMAWEVWWALILGFVISAVVQAWIPRERVRDTLAGGGLAPVLRATGLGAASSSCSYAAVAIARSLFEKGASLSSALAFQLASTNLVWELGLVLWVLIGWQFTVAEYAGGVVMILLVALLARVFLPRDVEDEARRNAVRAAADHHHGAGAEGLSWRERLLSASGWSEVSANLRHDVRMLWKEIGTGFLLAGLIAQFNNHFLTGILAVGPAGLVRTLWGALVGPIVAVLSFVCSVGNVPLAAVLWSGGISFAGVIAFLFADLIVLPIVLIYRKYYGDRAAIRITALLFVTMVLAALAVNGVFSALGLIPTGARPTRADIFSSIAVNYTLFLDIAGLVAFAALMWLVRWPGDRAEAACH